MKLNNIITVSEFAHKIEALVQDKGIGYRDALLLFAEKQNIEIETIASLVKQSSSLKNKVQTEAIADKMVKPKEA